MDVREVAEVLGKPSVMLRVRDLGRSLAWFERTLGLAPFASGVDGKHPYAAFSFSGAGVALWQLEPDDPDPETNLSSSYLVFSVASNRLEELRAHLVSTGTPSGDIRESSVARFFWFYDPDGHRFEASAGRQP